ncbi:hypothetical protein BvCmsKSP071_03849 [Escherichia coli]|uniref:hypothetical protein n=1 Tax=Escherichia coli TaxID=562 RepID=UPI0010CC45D8|nr:hypothetical protein [Escherichia coli]MXE22807.1 hypothetical protein [Escherichia coli]GDN17158.1 hypothetical protein BvCmsKSP071_03849 [Escherichia coli]GDN54170.1 hypothetical protein BvCmsKSP065_01221 [Escherichia coli]GDO26440.1 hypothetical protein BvCmsKSP093_03464 [Escherichia coli]
MKKIVLLFILLPIFAQADISASSYYKCIKDNVVKYSKTSESAESIASAAVTSCGSVLGEVLKNSAPFMNASNEAKSKFIADMKAQGKEAGIKYAMDEKLNKS